MQDSGCFADNNDSYITFHERTTVFVVVEKCLLRTITLIAMSLKYLLNRT